MGNYFEFFAIEVKIAIISSLSFSISVIDELKYLRLSIKSSETNVSLASLSAISMHVVKCRFELAA